MRIPAKLMCLLVATYGVAMWVTNNAPSLNAPLGPELLGLALALGLMAWGWDGAPRSGVGSSGRWGLIGLGLLSGITLVRALRSFFALEHAQALCGLMPGLVQRLECSFQAATNQNSALRTALYFVVALALFGGSYLASRRSSQAVAPALVVVPALFTVGTLILHLGGWHLSGFWSSVVAGDYADSRLSYLMGNPTWIAPYLAPGLVVIAAYLIAPRTSLGLRLFLSIVLLPMLYVLLKTQQRGALLIVCLYVGVLLFLALRSVIERLRGGRPLSVRVLGLWALGWVGLVGLTLYLAYEPLSKVLFALGFGDRLMSTSLASVERAMIWKGAMSGMPGHWLWGHGYGSWYREGSTLGAKFGFNEVLDTAHNFFVQIVFELGLVQVLALVLCISLIVVQVYRTSQDRPRTMMLLLVAGAVYLPILLVQEIDFIRSVYTLNALTWGWMVGAHWYDPPLSQKAKDREIQDHANVEVSSQWLVKSFVPGTLAAGSVSCLVGALLTGVLFSYGGYQYEANAHTQYAPRVRWLRPFGTVTFVAPTLAKEGLFASYTMPSIVSGKYKHNLHSAGTTEWVTAPATSKSYLPLAARPWWQRPDTFETEGHQLDNGRLLGAMLEWPPVLTALPLRWAEGLHGWEKIPALFGDKGVQWCGASCRIRLAACPRPADQRALRLFAARPDIGPGSPLAVKVTFGDVLPQPGKEVVFRGADESQEILVPTEVPLTLTVSRVFQPAGDGRQLGIMLTTAMCKEAPIGLASQTQPTRL